MADADLVPNAVAQIALQYGLSSAKAWRIHFGLTQVEMAKRLGTSQSYYSRLEACLTLSKKSRAKVATALGISDGQLDF